MPCTKILIKEATTCESQQAITVLDPIAVRSDPLEFSHLIEIICHCAPQGIDCQPELALEAGRPGKVTRCPDLHEIANGENRNYSITMDYKCQISIGRDETLGSQMYEYSY